MNGTARLLFTEAYDRRMPIDPTDPTLVLARELLEPWLRGGDLSTRVERLNAIRSLIGEFSPFSTEPVDCVLWVPHGQVVANDYNPNTVAPPEMELLRLSIMADGYTQPIVTNAEETAHEVVDGFHRNRVGRECDDVRERVHGYLPIVQIQSSRTDKADRMAATIRHNRARGKHRVEGMSEIVLALKRRNWSDTKIGKELGMDPDEVLRLAQITGLAEAFKDREFSLAWEVEATFGEPEDTLQDVDPVSAVPPASGSARDVPTWNWEEHTANVFVMKGVNGSTVAQVKRASGSQFWRVWIYGPPIVTETCQTKEEGQSVAERLLRINRPDE